MSLLRNRGPSLRATFAPTDEGGYVEVIYAPPDAIRNGHPRQSNICVVGSGHVGTVMASGFASLGHNVVGIDKSEALVRSLSDGDLPFHEEGLSDLVRDGVSSGRLRFTTSYADAVPEAEFIFLAVDTPATPAGAADLRNIRAAAHSIATSLNGTNPIIVNKSTSPIGTGETIDGIIRRTLIAARRSPRIVSNPEFLRQGRAVFDFFNPDRIVIGSRSSRDARAVAGLYEGLGGEVLITSLRTAEMIKYVANSFLATRISFINEVARLCEALGVDIDRVVEGIGHDKRIGTAFFRPGIGFGGSCLPKDIAALRYMGEAMGITMPMLSAVQQVNQRQRADAVRKLRSLMGNLDSRRVAVWGVTFKGDTEDTRESPAVDVVGLLLNEGAEVKSYDPVFASGDRPAGLQERIADTLCASPLEAAKGAEALCVLTDWADFKSVPLDELRRAMAGDIVLDGRNLLDQEEIDHAGFVYVGMGRPIASRRVARRAALAA